MADEGSEHTPEETQPRGSGTFAGIVATWLVLVLAAAGATVWTALASHSSSSLFLEILRLVVSLPVVALVLVTALVLTFHEQLARFMRQANELPTPWGPFRAGAPAPPSQSSKGAPGVPLAVAAELADEEQKQGDTEPGQDVPDAPAPQIAPTATQTSAIQPELIPKTTAESDLNKIQWALLTQERLRVYWFFRYLAVALPTRAIDVLRWLNRFSYPTGVGPTTPVDVQLTFFESSWGKAIPLASDRTAIIAALRQNALIEAKNQATLTVTWQGTRLIAFVDATWNPITEYAGDQNLQKCECCGAEVASYLARLNPHNKPNTDGETADLPCECSNRVVAW